MKQHPKTSSTAMERLVRALAQVMVDEYLAEERETSSMAKPRPSLASNDDSSRPEGHGASGNGGRSAADAETITMVAALVAGDRWLSADACAVFLGMVTPKGSPNRHGFLERVACRP